MQTQKGRKQSIVRLTVAGLAMMQTMMFAVSIYFYDGDIEPPYLSILYWGGFLMALPAVFYSVQPFYRGARRDLKNCCIGMNTPVTLAIVMTFTTGIYSLATDAGQGIYSGSTTTLMFFLPDGRLMEQIARRKIGNTTERLVKLVLVFCHKMVGFPANEEVRGAVVAQLQSGDVVLAKPGGVVPADGTMLSGESKVNEAMPTGGSLPAAKVRDAKIVAGMLSATGLFVIRIDSTGSGMQLAHIVRLLDHALAQKLRPAKMADRYASAFVFGELLLAAPMFAGQVRYADAQTTLQITIALLMTTCPCALSLATPAALAASIDALTAKGVLVEGRQSLETLTQIDDIMFGKTETLTKGGSSVGRIIGLGRLKNDEALAVAQALERQSEHPATRAILHCPLSNDPPHTRVGRRVNCVGCGVSARIDVGGKTLVWALGRAGFVAETVGVLLPDVAHIAHDGGIVFLSNSEGFQMAFLLEDSIKGDAVGMAAELKKHEVRLHLLNGDRTATVARVAAQLSLDEYRAEATSEDKLVYVEDLQWQGREVLIVGDGINDAPILAHADVSAAVTGGADVARDGVDVVLLDDDMGVLPLMIDQAACICAAIRQNLSWASAYNIIAVLPAVLGYVKPWIATLGTSASSLLVLGSALRLLKK